MATLTPDPRAVRPTAPATPLPASAGAPASGDAVAKRGGTLADAAPSRPYAHPADGRP